MKSLRRELEAGTAFERQRPFVLRPFRPYLGDTRISNAVAYGCYRQGQGPGQSGPTDAELLEDLQIISRHWHLIRVYGADRNTRRILQVIRDYDLPIKVIQGIWLSPEDENPRERSNNITSTLLGVELANEYHNTVISVCVGNETGVAWSPHRMQQETVIRYIRAVRNNVIVPVTTADDYLFWRQPGGRVLSDETDFVFAHMHPMWNEQAPEAAVDWLDRTYREVQKLYSDRPVVIGETGWATNYNRSRIEPYEHGSVIPGVSTLEAQADFLIELDQWIDVNRVTTFLFEAFDEPWKGGGDATPASEIEKNWGVYYESRTPKPSFMTYLNHRRSKST